MEKELEKKFEQVHEGIDKLATMVAEGFSAVDSGLQNVREDIAELRSEIRSIRIELERIPDDIDATYAKSLNDLFERVRVIEKRLGITA